MGPLLLKYGMRAGYDSTLLLQAKVAAVINGNSWCWPAARSDSLVEIQIQLCGDLQAVEGQEDRIFCKCSASGDYEAHDVWKTLGGKSQELRLVQTYLGHSFNS